MTAVGAVWSLNPVILAVHMVGDLADGGSIAVTRGIELEGCFVPKAAAGLLNY